VGWFVKFFCREEKKLLGKKFLPLPNLTLSSKTFGIEGMDVI